MQTHKIAVLITCHNRYQKTLDCLESLFDASLPDNFELEVFLVDDGSADGTGDIIKKNYPKVNVIRGDGNLYWNRGMNLAWQTAADKFNYDFYFWLNDDVILFKESIHVLVNDFQKVQDIDVIIVGACQSGKGNVTYSGINSLKEKRRIIPNGVVQKCDYFNGNVVLVTSAVFKQVGFLDPIYNHARGDFDYGLRAKNIEIYSFVSSKFVGICERNVELPIWCNPSYPFTTRLKNFRTPLGGNPKLAYIFQRKYIGLFTALFHYFTIHVRLFFPRIWTSRFKT